MTKTFLLAFADDDGSDLGACVIEVNEDQATTELQRMAVTHPQAMPGAEWLGAAMRQAWAAGCNPGGHVLIGELPDQFADLPREVLLREHDPAVQAILNPKVH